MYERISQRSTSLSAEKRRRGGPKDEAWGVSLGDRKKKRHLPARTTVYELVRGEVGALGKIPILIADRYELGEEKICTRQKVREYARVTKTKGKSFLGREKA